MKAAKKRRVLLWACFSWVGPLMRCVGVRFSNIRCGRAPGFKGVLSLGWRS